VNVGSPQATFLFGAVVFGLLLLALLHRATQLWLRTLRLQKNADPDPASGSASLLQQLLASSGEHRAELVALLLQAGQREPAALRRHERRRAVCLAAGIATPLLLIVSGAGAGSVMFFGAVAVGAGRYLPSFLLRQTVAARQTRIAAALPAAVELVVLCLEAGLGVEQAFQRISQEIASLEPVVADELAVMINEVSAGMPFAEAVKRMADRTGLQEVVVLARLVAQGAGIGASLASTLRDYTEASYQRRMLGLEERAGKMSAATSLPVAACLLPSSLLLIGGPPAVMILQTLGMLR
jgi:tight adherence protein C